MDSKKGEGTVSENVSLKYGDKKIEIAVENAASITYLNENPMREIVDLKEEFLKAVNENVIGGKPLCDIVSAEDLVTIVISDITRFWMRQDQICEILVDYLTDELRVPYENIAVVVANGTHRFQTEEELCKLASKRVYEKVSVINHDCDADDLVFVGTTSFGTDVWVNPLAVDRRVIIVGGTVHHIMAGYGGGRKSIVPGIAGRETIKQNHTRALSQNEAKTDPRVGSNKLLYNPIHEDMDEAAALVAPAFGINIVVNTASKHSGLFCGEWQEAWLESCRYVQNGYGVSILKEADIVIASCGGYPKDINLYQATKSLFNATRAVKKGGTLIFLAESREGGGAKDFFDWILPLQKGTLDADLRKDFTIGGYIFYAACESIKKSRILMLSEIDKEIVKDMDIAAYSSLEDLMKQVDFTGKDVYVIPYGGSVFPCLPD